MQIKVDTIRIIPYNELCEEIFMKDNDKLKVPEVQAKKEYHSPKLAKYGKLHELTAKLGPNSDGLGES